MLRRVELYRGQEVFETRIGGVVRNLPVIRIDRDIWIASDANLILGDTDFIYQVAGLMAEKLSPLNPEVILTPEAKAIAFAYQVARNLGHSRMVVGRKSVKSYMTDYLLEKVKSITTREQQIIVLTKEDAEHLSGKSVCLLDDVVSTGGTVGALERLVRKAGGKVACIASIWVEGPWFTGDLIRLGELPVFVSESKLRELEASLAAGQTL